MTALEKARLEVVDKNGTVTDSVPVQFNPTTMSLQMSNSNDGGSSRGRQTQQYNGSSSTTLSLDLEFDTADEGTTEQAVDVRTRTAAVRQFVLPGSEASKAAPPRVRFRWGTFELTGVMSSLSEELSLFSAGGVALRSKLSIQIKEQDPKFDALERGPGANPDPSAPAAGEAGADVPGGPGTSGGGVLDRAAAALSGETAADFLSRNGLAPEAWRALGGALDALSDGIELEAGLSVEFDSSLSIGAGLGVSAGFSAGLDVSVGASLGLEIGGGGSGSARSAGLQQGFALSASGGVTAAAEASARADASQAAARARSAFGASPSGSTPGLGPARTAAALAARSAATGAPRPPLGSGLGSGGPASTAATARGASTAAPAPLPPKADPRSVTFGRGIPLRDRVVAPGAEPSGYVVIGGGSPVDLASRSRRPGRTPPWERLTPSSSRSTRAGSSGRAGGHCGCGCGGRCGG